MVDDRRQKTNSLQYDIITAFQLGVALAMSEVVTRLVRSLDLYDTGSMNIWVVRVSVAVVLSAVLLAFRSFNKPKRVRQTPRRNDREDFR